MELSLLLPASDEAAMKGHSALLSQLVALTAAEHEKGGALSLTEVVLCRLLNKVPLLRRSYTCQCPLPGMVRTDADCILHEWQHAAGRLKKLVEWSNMVKGQFQ